MRPGITSWPVAEPVVEAVVEPAHIGEFKTLGAELEVILMTVRQMKSRLGKLEKLVSKDRKEMEKKIKGRRKRVADPNAEPSGFAKPGPISDELAKFLGTKKGELVARTEVTKGINKYCKKHGLQKEEDKRTILPDAKLSKLLRLKKGDDVGQLVDFFDKLNKSTIGT